MKPLKEYTPEELLAFKQAADKLRELKTVRILTPILLVQLMVLAKQYAENEIDFNLLTYENYPRACGCMGPQDGNMYCRCEMNSLLAEYRYDVAIELRRQF